MEEKGGRRSRSSSPPGLAKTDTTPPTSRSVSRSSIATSSTAASSSSIDNQVASDCSSLSSANHTQDGTTMKEDAEVVSFRRFFDSILSTDAHERKSAEDELTLLPPCSKASFLMKAYRIVETVKHRRFALNTLCAHVENHWNTIFPRFRNDEKRDQFCHELLSAVENEKDASFRATLAHLVAVVARLRLEDSGGVQDWDALMEYMELSPRSSTDVHMRAGLAIVMAVPHVFGDQSETCRHFFQECMWNELEPESQPEPEIIKAYLAVHSSAKCTQDTRRLLEDRPSSLATMMDNYHQKKRALNGSPSYELTELLLVRCLESANVHTQMLGLNVIKCFPRQLDRGCAALLKSLIESCLWHSHPAARSTALSTYADVVMEGDNEQSPLRDIFPSILSMCYEDPLVEEERQIEDTADNKFTPLDCLKQLATPLLLLQPHLQAIIDLCRQIIADSSPDQLDVNERPVCFSILHGLVYNYWTRISATFGPGYMKDLCEFTIKYTAERDLTLERTELILLFTAHDETAERTIGFLDTVLPDIVKICESDSAPHQNKATSMEILHRVSMFAPNLLKHVLAPLVALCCKICNGGNFELQQPATLILRSLCESSGALFMTRAVDQIPDILEWALRQAAAVDDDYFLATEQDEFEDEDLRGPDLLAQTICRLSAAHIIPALGRIARKYAKDGDAQKRYMCVLAWAYVILRCKPEFITMITNKLVSYLEDTHAHVRGIACCSLQRLTKLNAESLAKIEIYSVLAALVPLYKDASLPRLAWLAGWTLSAFITIAPKHYTPIFTGILDESAALLESQMMAWLVDDKHFLLDSTLAPICGICTKDPRAVDSYNDRLLSLLIPIIRERPGAAILVTLINCISFIGHAAGREKFLNDGIEMLKVISADVSPFLSDDTEAGHVARILDVIGVQSARFLPALVPQLLAACKETEAHRDDSEIGRYRRELLGFQRKGVKKIIACLEAHTGDAFAAYAKDVAALGI